jgi:hypothetical protein
LEAYYGRALCHRNREGREEREEREEKGLKRARQAIRFREGKTERLPAVNRDFFLNSSRGGSISEWQISSGNP